MKDRKMIARIIELSSKALAEEERGRFIDCLRERSALLAQVEAGHAEANVEALRTWLEKELEIAARLEKERLRVLRDIDLLSMRKKAACLYQSRLPFPSMPVFLSEAG